uniref:Uncharacterized protein n=1 Tax=Oryza meridionalis TaxID=40149 RepID=A0A0E0CMY5_9ORYZ
MDPDEIARSGGEPEHAAGRGQAQAPPPPSCSCCSVPRGSSPAAERPPTACPGLVCSRGC